MIPERLPNGNLRVSFPVEFPGGGVADAVKEIGVDDPDYEHWLPFLPAKAEQTKIPDSESLPSPPGIGLAHDGSPFTVKTVDAAEVRSQSPYAQEFGLVATHLGFPKLIPAGEIWIADNVTASERPFLIDKGRAQLLAMQQGKGHEDAEDYAEKTEAKERKRSEGAPDAHQKDALDQNVPKTPYAAYADENLHPVTVYLVDGEYVRNHIDPDYMEGGHDRVYHYVPHGEIWLEQTLHPEEIPAILLHESHERELMEPGGLSYDEAHERAAKAEFAFRQKHGAQKVRTDEMMLAAEDWHEVPEERPGGGKKWVNKSGRVEYGQENPGGKDKTEKQTAPPSPKPEHAEEISRIRLSAAADLAKPHHPLNKHKGGLTEASFVKGAPAIKTIRSTAEQPLSAEEHRLMAAHHGRTARIASLSGQHGHFQAHAGAAGYHTELAKRKSAAPPSFPQENVPRVFDESVAKSISPRSEAAFKSLTEHEQNDVKQYTGTAALPINESLYSGKLDSLFPSERGIVDSLDKAINAAGELEKPITSWRGIHLNKEHAQVLHKKLREAAANGGHVTMDAYVSTSLDPNKAAEFRGYGAAGAMLEISSRKGLYVDPFSLAKKRNEKEWLLGRGNKFRVHGVKKVKVRMPHGDEEHEVFQLEQL